MTPPLGSILAGGRGTRLGGAKACVPVAGQPLIAWPLQALRAALDEVIVVCKRDSELPALAGAEVVYEPDRPAHPLAGILAALAHAAGRPVLVCAVDLPLVTPALVGRLMRAGPGRPAAIARASGRPQPLLARYEPAAVAILRDTPPDAPLTETVLSLGPAFVDVEESLLHNVNTPGDVAVAERLLGTRTPSRAQ